MFRCFITKYLARKFRPSAALRSSTESNTPESRGELRMAARLEDMLQELLAVTKALQLVIAVAARSLPNLSALDRADLFHVASFLDLVDPGEVETGMRPDRATIEAAIVRIAETRKIHYARVDLVLVTRLIIAIVGDKGNHA